jgi:predicted DNA-binding protein
MRTTKIRVPAETRDRLNALARRRGTSAAQVVAELVQSAADDALLADAAASWERSGLVPEARARYRAETEELASFDVPVPLAKPD